MSRIAIELVPRDEVSLLTELDLIKNNFPVVDTINIPDLLRYEIRSWEGCTYAQPNYKYVIPHIRAIDINLDQPLRMADFFKEKNINEVLVIKGDPPQDMTHKIYPSTSIDVIRKFKEEIPGIKVYAGIDQYRDSMRKEADYIKQKIYAGADGFFTQPFFDLRLMEIYSEILEGKEVYWGISPVTSEKSLNYWETKNNVVFPTNFQPNLAWNIEFAQKALEFTGRTNANIYFMPIRTDVHKYLQGIFAGN
ncbi:methylenetetrahydrofolate reductase [Dendrosporobacter sp. 1207_IL3150]|uniref:methylenetetrahydrofolate reductase n=1 Tax=Dendrosporobacter sp. 1207_IL3150 TaxID=3084054 RepID=UPI002FDA9923